MSTTQSKEQRIDEIVDQDVMYENLGLTEANAKILKKYLRNAIHQHTIDEQIEENEKVKLATYSPAVVRYANKRIAYLESQKKNTSPNQLTDTAVGENTSSKGDE